MKRAAYEPTSACETTDSRYRSSSPGKPSPNRNNPRRDFTTSPPDRTHFFNTPTRREWGAGKLGHGARAGPHAPLDFVSGGIDHAVDRVVVEGHNVTGGDRPRVPAPDALPVDENPCLGCRHDRPAARAQHGVDHPQQGQNPQRKGEEARKGELHDLRRPRLPEELQEGAGQKRRSAYAGDGDRSRQRGGPAPRNHDPRFPVPHVHVGAQRHRSNHAFGLGGA